MKWIIIVVCVLIAIIVLTYLIGLTLPVKHTASVKKLIPAQIKDVWLRITTPEQFADWRSGVDKVEVINDSEWKEFSGRDMIPFRIKEKGEMSRLVTGINTQDLPYGGEWIYELEPHGSGTWLTITENGEVYNGFFRFVFKFIMGHRFTINKYLDDLTKSFKK